MGRSEMRGRTNNSLSQKLVGQLRKKGEEFNWQFLRRKNENYSKTLKERFNLELSLEIVGLRSLQS